MRTGSLLIVALLLATAPLRAEGLARPHIVLFLADDLGYADCSVYGGKEVKTPNMDRLAAAGMTFTHAFVASPSCAPSRAALLTGLDPMRNGAMLNHSRPKEDVKKWPAYFKDLGYEVAAIGKVAHYAQVKEYGFDHVSHFNYHQDDCIEAAGKWLAGRKSDKPLCLLVGTNWPHVPWPKEAKLDPEKLTLPPTLVDTKETRQARARYLEAVANADRDLGLVYDAARKHLGKDALFLFTGDHGAQFPFGKWNAYDAGIRTPLIVEWPGKVKPGSKSDALVSWIDILPTCLETAGGKCPEGLSGKSFAGILRGEKTTHRDKVFVTHSADGDMNRYPLRAVRTKDWKYIRNLDPTAEHHTHVDKGKNADADGRNYWDSWVQKAKTDKAAAAVISRYHKRPAEELYDLTADPHELKNLADDKTHADRLKALRADLDAWMKEQGDEGLKTERALADPRDKKETREPPPLLNLPDAGTDPKAIDYAKLPVLKGTHAVINATEEKLKFQLHSYLVYHDNRYWCMWSQGPPVEDEPSQQIRYSTSADGIKWSEAKVLASPAKENYGHIARGFWVRDGELLALYAHYKGKGAFGADKELRLEASVWDAKAAAWKPKGLVYDNAINNFPPQQLPTGEWMMTRRDARFNVSVLVGGKKALDDWQSHTVVGRQQVKGFSPDEPIWWGLPDKSLVGLFRDNGGSGRLFRSFSTDNGKTWTPPEATNFPNATSKALSLATSKGYRVLISNANPGVGRRELHLSLSEDGQTFTRMALLSVPSAKPATLQYPHVIEQDSHLLITYSRNKAQIEVLKIPLRDMESLRSKP